MVILDAIRPGIGKPILKKHPGSALLHSSHTSPQASLRDRLLLPLKPGKEPEQRDGSFPAYAIRTPLDLSAVGRCKVWLTGVLGRLGNKSARTFPKTGKRERTFGRESLLSGLESLTPRACTNSSIHSSQGGLKL